MSECFSALRNAYFFFSSNVVTDSLLGRVMKLQGSGPAHELGNGFVIGRNRLLRRPRTVSNGNGTDGTQAERLFFSTFISLVHFFFKFFAFRQLEPSPAASFLVRF